MRQGAGGQNLNKLASDVYEHFCGHLCAYCMAEKLLPPCLEVCVGCLEVSLRVASRSHVQIAFEVQGNKL